MDERKTKVLIVEGDADEASIIGTYFAAAPDHADVPELTPASRISTACHLLARGAFDAVVLDLVLPQSVGLEGFHKIRAVAPTTPVIVLTGLHDVPLAVQALEAGAFDFFIKGSAECCMLRRAVRYARERGRLADSIEGLLGMDDSLKLVVDSGSNVLYANDAARAMFGRGESGLKIPAFAHVLPAADGELTIPAPKVPERTLGLRVRTISWRGREARLVTLRDGAPGEQLKRLKAEIKEGLRVVEVKNHFLSQISHELRNTLSAVTTAAYCLKDGIGGSLSAQQSRLVGMIARNADRQAKIIENVLDLARFQSGKLKIQFQPTDVNAIIAQIVEECGLMGARAKIRVVTDGRLPSVKGDPDLISQVLRNLVVNAARFAQKEIVVEADLDGEGDVAVHVVDDGAGIPPERFGDLFTEFLQLERPADSPPNVHGYKGTGLGLTISKEIIMGHRGRIWAENVPGRGARFSFTLPVRERAEDALLDDGRVSVPSGPRHAAVTND